MCETTLCNEEINKIMTKDDFKVFHLFPMCLIRARFVFRDMIYSATNGKWVKNFFSSRLFPLGTDMFYKLMTYIPDFFSTSSFKNIWL